MSALIILVLSFVLVIGFTSTKIAQTLRVPHSVFLVFLGVTSGFLLRHAGLQLAFSSDVIVDLFPELVLYVFLPPLVFESAYNLDFTLLRKEIVAIASLSVVALLLSTLFIGVGLHWVFGLDLLACLTFGALISATDPVSVIALFKEVGAPKRLAILVEGESLLNDATAIVLFRLLLAAALTATLDRSFIAEGALQFTKVSLGGVGIGLTFAFILKGLLKWTRHSAAAQLGLTASATYFTFVISDHYLGMSGIISVMALGLYLSANAPGTLNHQAIQGMHFVWEFLALSANVFVFFAVGFIVDPQNLIESFRYIPLTLAIAYLARALSVGGCLGLLNRLKFGPQINFRYQIILVWGGLRGGLALGLALLLPPLFPHRDLFIALATAVVFSTLFLNAVTTRKVLKLVKLDQGA